MFLNFVYLWEIKNSPAEYTKNNSRELNLFSSLHNSWIFTG
jgi:hypothetical protein